MFKVENSNGKAVITAYGYIGGYIDFRSISEALDGISRAGIRAVDIRFHTEGGSVIDGNLIYNFLSSFNGEIDFYIDGIAASMGSVIIMAGTRVHIAENGFIMIHRPKGEVRGNVNDLVGGAKLLRSIEKNFAEKLAAKMGKTVDQVSAEYLNGADHWIDADEAIALGLANDKYTALNGAITFTKDYAAQVGAKSLYNAYTALAVEQKPETTKPVTMEKIIAKLNLKEGALEPEAVTAIEAIEARAAAAELALQSYKDKEASALVAEATTLVDAAITEQRIEASAKDAYIKLFAADHESAKAALAAIPKRVTAKDIVGAGEPDADPVVKMSWDQADRAGKLAFLKEKHPDIYNLRFVEKFGVEPAK